ncbi:MFS general substrate transporter [Moesziomyces antarcticus]|uniref:Related to putative acetyl-coenzyme A transporter n=1 Tax=Pseudozyma antarctica TaxID=84753 RepID=A0A5C3FKW0_PSEA2|nr:MFS general substrate transporter [Moesziomyces antarcticus]GAK63664.1 MFS general substrate transporter [Moesziomyces antarcticus]SPO44257.1 related to putative acetyl-coenzyme A transporter [Moesziomyces antarcticus]
MGAAKGTKKSLANGAGDDVKLRQRPTAAMANGTPSSEAVETSDLLATRHASIAEADIETKDAKQGGEEEASGFMDLSPRDQRAMILLVVLYLLQGVPVGLAFGTMPFLLKTKLSYGDIGFFMLCTYPYSLKLFWSPIVDSTFVNELQLPLIGKLSLGRRKSWIVPIQTIVGVMFWYLSRNVDQLLLADLPNVKLITLIFFVLILFAATQDIAVDGWALTLLSQENLSYASTAQTVGLNSGYFLSFTVFLAFNSVEFSNKYFRSAPLDYPLLSLSAYMRFWAVGFIVVTSWLLFFQKEDEEADNAPDMDVKKVYSIMWRICQLKHVQTFILIHFVAKIGFQANEAVTGLKLVEKGFGKEDLALAVLIDFPFQLIFGYLAARWSKGDKALQPWVVAFFFRLGFAVLSMAIVHGMPSAPIGAGYFFVVIASTVAGSFASTVQFVGISAFHTQIADPLIGGTYMTLLNTVSNLGGTWPRYFVLKAVDLFTVSSCQPPSSALLLKDAEIAKLWATASKGIGGNECTSDLGKAACSAAGGECYIERDGYYWTSTLCVVVGTALLVTFIIPACRKLQALPPSAWRVNLQSHPKSQ